MAERKNRLSPEGRLRCSAAGHRNVAALIEARRDTVPSVKAATIAFESDLAAQVGPDPTAAQRALMVAAIASYSALFSVSRRLRSAYRYPRLVALAEQVVPLSGALQRSLRALGLTASTTDGDPEPGSALAEYLASRAVAAESEASNGEG